MPGKTSRLTPLSDLPIQPVPIGGNSGIDLAAHGQGRNGRSPLLHPNTAAPASAWQIVLTGLGIIAFLYFARSAVLPIVLAD